MSLPHIGRYRMDRTKSTIVRFIEDNLVSKNDFAWSCMFFDPDDEVPTVTDDHQVLKDRLVTMSKSCKNYRMIAGKGGMSDTYQWISNRDSRYILYFHVMHSSQVLDDKFTLIPNSTTDVALDDHDLSFTEFIALKCGNCQKKCLKDFMLCDECYRQCYCSEICRDSHRPRHGNRCLQLRSIEYN